MTSVWGPLGWITLHSIAAGYPESPSQDNKNDMTIFLENFKQTMTCPHCKQHFGTLLDIYRQTHPEFLNSKRDLFLFTVRAHNTVNRRLDKPILSSIAECIDTLKNATKNVKPSDFRNHYFTYLIRNWSYWNSGEGILMVASVKEMRRRYEKLFENKPDIEFNVTFEEADTREFITPSTSNSFRTAFFTSTLSTISPSIGFKGGKLKLGRN